MPYVKLIPIAETMRIFFSKLNKMQKEFYEILSEMILSLFS